ncbi:MAG: M16 family metallopeptidase [Sphingopyxis sp.]
MINLYLPSRFNAATVSLVAFAVMLLPAADADARGTGREAQAVAVTRDPLASVHFDIPSTKIVLENGLTLIVNEDRSAPLVAVNITYHVGSKDESDGKTGFAHLFEHLMFNGSEHFDDDFFKATEKLGATEQNGNASYDKTTYYQTVPTNALDSVLWLESDRMGHFLGSLTQTKLDEQRAVVKNEKRERESDPYSQAYQLIDNAVWPTGHPYHHSPIGSEADIDGATLEDVKQWFRDYYGPSNAVVTLSGDIGPAEAKAKVEKYFGDIAPGNPIIRTTSWPVRREETVRQTVEARVANPVLHRTWRIGNTTSADADYIQIVGRILSGSRNARLVKRLILDEKLAIAVGADVDSRELDARFTITALLHPGTDLGRVEAIIDEEIGRLRAEGPTPQELAIVRTSLVAGMTRGYESRSARAAALADSQVLLGSPDGWRISFERIRKATPLDVRNAAIRALTGGEHILAVVPFGTLSASAKSVDRAAMPLPGPVASASFPAADRATLANGLKLVVVPRPGVPIIDMALLVNTGFATDYAAVPMGTGAGAMNLMTQATTSLPLGELENRLGSLGSTLTSGGGGEVSFVGLSAFKPVLQPALDIFSDVILHPAFDAKDIERNRRVWLSNIAAAKADGDSAASWFARQLLYGKDNPYGRVQSEPVASALTREDFVAFHERWFKPNNATLFVVGDTTLAEIRPLIERAFINWKAAPVPAIVMPRAEPLAEPVIYLFDNPGATQSTVRALVPVPPRADENEVAVRIFNRAIGGTFTSRLNMTLREEKGWAYGASSEVSEGRGTRTFQAKASVQTDRTAESMAEILRILEDAAGRAPLNKMELDTAKESLRLGLGSEWSSAGGILSYLEDQAVADAPDNFYSRYADTIAETTLAQVNQIGADILRGKPLLWVVSGDLSKIESKVRALGVGDVRVLDSRGNRLR